MTGGVISVALSFESPRLGVTQRPALRSPDFPPDRLPLRGCGPAVAHPPRPTRDDNALSALSRVDPVVDALVGERIGTLVLLAGNVGDDHVRKGGQQARGPGRQRLECGVLHLVVAVDLLHDQLRIEEDLELVGFPVGDGRQALDERQVLRDVVGGGADEAAEPSQAEAGLVLDDDSQPSRPGIAARCAVGVDPKDFQGRRAPQACTRMRWQFWQLNRSPRRNCWSSLAVSCTRHPSQVPFTIAATGWGMRASFR